MIKLANASTSTGPGDRQVRVQEYYEKNWDYIIRPHQKYINGLAFFAEKLCENNNVLYSQEQRLTLNNLLKKNNYNLSCINEKVYCDCSSFVGACLNGVGVLIDVATFTTRTMVATCKRLGFEIIKFDKSRIMKGDILVKEGVHTVIVVEAIVSEMGTVGEVYLNDKNSYLNVREKATVNSKVVGTLKYGDKVNILCQSGNWYNIQVGETKGYCSKSYIRHYQ